MGVISTFATPQNSTLPTTENPYSLIADVDMELCAASGTLTTWTTLPEEAMHPMTEVSPALDLVSIPYLENEDEGLADLGFDTSQYLPANFDPYGAYHEVVEVAYVEEEIPVHLGFETSAYLPGDFNPYDVPRDFMDISYIEPEEEIVLGFDPAPYLPSGFDPYEDYFDLDAVVYIEEEEEVILDFNPKDYLPAGFNPYSR